MDQVETDFLTQLIGAFAILIIARLSLLLSWPLFLWMEKKSPVQANVPRSNYVFNWQITFWNVALSPVFSAAMVVSTVAISAAIGLPSLDISLPTINSGLVIVDLLLQGSLIFLAACLVGDLWYYWWHRLQHTVPFLWEIHKLHHSDRHLNTTTIYRSHFLEPAGQALVRGLTIGLVFDITKAPEGLLAAVCGGLLLALWDYFIHANVRVDALHRLPPFFSNPQFHWIHHSSLPQHQDKNFSIWMPVYDKLFGTYYQAEIDEYPPTGLSSGEDINTLWEAHTGPFRAWWGSSKQRQLPSAKERNG